MFGIDFLAARRRIVHQVVLENYAFPGGPHDRRRLAHAQRGGLG
jgi:hypothetical protein